MSAHSPPSFDARFANGNGYNGAQHGQPRSGTSSNRSSNGTPADRLTDGTRHIDDLRAEANARATVMRYLPIGHLLSASHDSINYAERLANFRKRDQAFLEYMVATELVTLLVPKHKDFPTLKSSRGTSANNLWREVVNRLDINYDRFMKIKDIIVNENTRNGITRLNNRSATPNGQVLSRPSSQQSTSRPSSSRGTDELFLDSSGTTFHQNGARPSSADQSLPDALRPKPPLRPPKPESLHGKAIHGQVAANANGVASLNERFSKLRTSNQQPEKITWNNARRIDSISDPLPLANGGSVRRPSPNDFTSTANHATRPLGPRAPPKIPLDTRFAVDFTAQMPKAPSPAYSPARNMQTPHGINPPRSSARSAVRTSSAASRAPNGDFDSYFPTNGIPTMDGHTHSRSSDSTSRRKGSVGLPSEGRTIAPEMLFDYLNMYTTLLIDVRSRPEFDTGHIDSQATICIEPLQLRPDMNDEMVQDTLILSPDSELSHFSRRDQFALVVYYDQSTTNPAFLNRADRTSAEDALRSLFDAMWELNVGQPLKRPPLLLEGGIDAWVDLLGQAALKSSDTAATKAAKSRRPARKPVPVPASPGTQIALERRRRREYNPLDPEEEQRWLESARKESVYIPLEAIHGEDIEEEGPEDETITPFYRTQEEFFRRFPAVSSEQESMVAPTASVPMPQADQYQAHSQPQPPSIPSYPSTATQSTGELPSRPAPVAPRFSYSGAHERSSAPYQNSHALTKTNSLQRYVSPSLMPQNTLLPKTGLVNFGVTCYMNSVIQVLSATIPLSQLFRGGQWEGFVQGGNWRGSRGVLPPHFANLIQALWAGGVDACRPSTFRRLCGRLKSEWSQDQQQDAKEFLDWILDYLHEDFNLKWRSPPPHVLTATEEATRERLAKSFASQIEWGRYVKRDKSIVSDLFAGQHCSTLRCLACGQTSTTYEAFFSISVEIPRSGSATLAQCLRSYCEEERLSGDERWVCPSCKKEREATKRITITRAPRTLVIHFKRFSASRSQSARKISTPISFPLQNLDISEFCLPPTTDHERAMSAKELQDPKLLTQPLGGKEEWDALAMTPPYGYDAYAVIRHLGGSVGSGHYIALCRDVGRGRWRKFNDSQVDDFRPEDLSPGQSLQNEQAYIVFYERNVGGGTQF